MESGAEDPKDEKSDKDKDYVICSIRMHRKTKQHLEELLLQLQAKRGKRLTIAGLTEELILAANLDSLSKTA